MNKFYIKFFFFLLSISIYVNNKTLATDPTPGKATKTKSKKSYSTSEEIYDQSKHLLCTDHEEIKNAKELMSEAVKSFAYHATSEGDYKCVGKNLRHSAFLYKKKHKNSTDVEKVRYINNDSNKYNEIVGKIWDPDILNPFDYKSVKRKIARVYNPNLVMIQQRYKDSIFARWKYFYALAAKFDISEDKTIIAMTSANINDHNPSENEYKNPIVENANLFKTEVDSEDDIKNGKLKKVFVNIAGYLIQKRYGHVNITYVESIDEHSSTYQKCIFGKTLGYMLLNIYFSSQ
ncbi:fam-a protein [Plasmodium vinckei brucechwatti]|uniref:Fam-a protein n=1 Tax=Plasmodium vinckei brucechwatti TaxID=119398 RepID=A0A6V7S2T5_PLAVN|nr:fam-a protein [Plasmodium vinckei brucechwatti]